MFEDEIESFIVPSLQQEAGKTATPEPRDAKAQAAKEMSKDPPSKIELSSHSSSLWNCWSFEPAGTPHFCLFVTIYGAAFIFVPCWFNFCFINICMTVSYSQLPNKRGVPIIREVGKTSEI